MSAACPLTAAEIRRLAEMKRMVLDGEPIGGSAEFKAEYESLATQLYGENPYASVEVLKLLADALEAKEQREVMWLKYADFLHAEMQKLAGSYVAHGYNGDPDAFERGRRFRSALGIRGSGERPNLDVAPLYDRDPGDEAVRS